MSRELKDTIKFIMQENTELRARAERAEAALASKEEYLKSIASEAHVRLVKAEAALAELQGDDDAWRRTYERTHAELLKAEAALRTVAERQREACAVFYERRIKSRTYVGGGPTEAQVQRAVDEDVRATPLVTEES